MAQLVALQPLMQQAGCWWPVKRGRLHVYLCVCSTLKSRAAPTHTLYICGVHFIGFGSGASTRVTHTWRLQLYDVHHIPSLATHHCCMLYIMQPGFNRPSRLPACLPGQQHMPAHAHEP